MSKNEKKRKTGPRRIEIESPDDEQAQQPAHEQETACEQAVSDEVTPPAEVVEEPPPDASVEEVPAEQDETAAAQIEALRKTLKELELKCAEAEQDRQRIAAELHNYKRRARQEREVAIRLANERLLADLIPVLDTFELAMQVEADSAAASSILEGINMVYGQLRSALRMHGVEQIEAEGRVFDPSLHEAVERQESTDVDPGTVLAELAKGYTLNGQVVRASKVRVATAPADETEGEGGEATGDTNG